MYRSPDEIAILEQKLSGLQAEKEELQKQLKESQGEVAMLRYASSRQRFQDEEEARAWVAFASSHREKYVQTSGNAARYADELLKAFRERRGNP